MGSESRFVYNPSTVDIGRSKFLMNSFWKGDMYHGDLVPLEITQVMPGDSAKYDVSLFIRTATPPIFPIMDSIKLYVRAFYVPTRLVWSKEKEFLGENTEGYGIQTEVLAPRSTRKDMCVYKDVAATTYKRSIATYLGIVKQKSEIVNGSPISLNPIRSFLQVYNDWFRNENFMPPYLWDHSQTGDASRELATIGGSGIYGLGSLPKVCKNLDRFTSCLPWAQKGSPVPVPLLGEAPVVAGNAGHWMKNDLVFGYKSGSNIIYPETDLGWGGSETHTSAYLLGTQQDGHVAYLIQPNTSAESDDYTPSASIQYSNLIADLSQATGASVNQLRLAFATQKYLEQLARSGSKYREYIRAMFGVTIGDTTAQMAEYLGGMCVELNVDQVLQSTGFSAGSSTTLGAPGASSTSAASDYLFTKSFDEPGYIVVVAYTKHNRTYGQGIDELYQKHEVLEDYNPKFANIGEQAIKKSNIFFTGDADDDDVRLGFQEAWSEYRYKKDMVVGSMAPSNSSSFNFTNLAENFASAPTLNVDFLTEDRTNIARCLAGGESSPDYFLDVKFNRTFIRPMPLYSVPGLIDHH